jgi:methyl-accepting chemotaxis protein
LIGQFEAYVGGSELLPQVKENLLAEIATYRDEFSIYGKKVLAGEGPKDGKGPFRDAAHRLEDLINQYYVPDLERDILQLRRREKDYLLRDDKRYVEMALSQIESIERRIQASGISSEDRDRFISLLQRYQTDFLALVEQNQQIASLTKEMEQVASKVGRLVKTNVESTNKAMEEMTRNINANAHERTVWMLWVIVIAIGLGIFFAIKITSYIVGPMRTMAAMLEQLTYTELVNRVPHTEKGRDEVNAMAGYLNIIAEHRNRFINWWKTSMNEAEACSQLESIMQQATDWDSDTPIEVDSLKAQLSETLATKKLLISKEFEEIEKLNEQILNSSSLLQHPSVSRGDVDEQSKAIHYAAELTHKSLQMLSNRT